MESQSGRTEANRKRWPGSCVQAPGTQTELSAGCALCGREHDPVVGATVAIREHAPDRVIALHPHAHRLLIPELVANVEMNAFAHDELAVVVDVDDLPGLALHRPGRVGKAGWCDPRRRRELQPEIVRLADVGRKVAARF